MGKGAWLAIILATLFTGYAAGYFFKTPPLPSGMAWAGPTVPPVRGYMEGEKVRFIHTETSDPQVANLLTRMMNSPVLVVASLAQAPESMLANVYVFKNGIRGSGPFKFQPDVFDRSPGTAGYSPLRALNLVTWKEEGAARLLTSATEVREAEARGEVTIARPGVVVNMPLLTWPGGRR